MDPPLLCSCLLVSSLIGRRRVERKSTAGDVKNLLDLKIAPGDMITWEAIEEALGLMRQDRRFQTIYRAWIRYMRKWHNRKLVVVPGKGMHLLRENQRAAN